MTGVERRVACHERNDAEGGAENARERKREGGRERERGTLAAKGARGDELELERWQSIDLVGFTVSFYLSLSFYISASPASLHKLRGRIGSLVVSGLRFLAFRATSREHCRFFSPLFLVVQRKTLGFPNGNCLDWDRGTKYTLLVPDFLAVAQLCFSGHFFFEERLAGKRYEIEWFTLLDGRVKRNGCAEANGFFYKILASVWTREWYSVWRNITLGEQSSFWLEICSSLHIKIGRIRIRILHILRFLFNFQFHSTVRSSFSNEQEIIGDL